MTNPFAHVLFVAGAWTVSAPNTNTSASIDLSDPATTNAVMACLRACRAPTPVTEVHATLAACGFSSEGLLDALLSCSLVVDADAVDLRWFRWADTPLRDVLAMWAGRELPRYVDYADPEVYHRDVAQTRAELCHEEPPPICLSHDDDTLPPVALWHPALGPAQSPSERLGEFVFAFMGALRVRKFMGVVDVLVKTVPSNGARHPFELYLDADGVPWLADGCYHYDPLRHAVVPLRCRPADVAKAEPGELTLTIVAHFERVQWRYREGWDIHEIDHDLGHLLANLGLAARDLGLVVTPRRPRWEAADLHTEALWSGSVAVGDAPPPARQTLGAAMGSR